MDLKTIEDEALSMSPEDRAKLAQKLILSLDLQEEIQESRLIEGERRARELDRGEVQPIPADEVGERPGRSFGELYVSPRGGDGTS